MLVSRKKEGASERLIRRLIRPRPRDGRVEGRGEVRNTKLYEEKDVIRRAISS